MPIFVKKFTKHPIKAREGRLNSVPKLVEEVDDFKRNITFKLDEDKKLKFVDGVWMNLRSNNSAENEDDVAKVHKTNQKLEGENRMLNAKMDILMDLLSEALAERMQ